jgi:hypothetical protein
MLRFLAVLLTGLALIAPGAHLYELANKMALAKSEYAVVQKIHIGWWTAGLLLPHSSPISRSPIRKGISSPSLPRRFS